MSKKLIDVDMWVESHENGTKGTRSTGSHGGAGFSQSSHADRADRADIADRAEAADEANHAKTADEANHAKTADEVNLESKTLSHFLRKDIPDTAVEVLTFLKGIVAKAVSYFQGIENRGDIKNNGDITNIGNISNAGDITNSGNIMTKNLTVTGKATFFELMIQITKAAGGMTIYSPGAFHIDDVEDKGNYFACFQRAEKDGVKLRQMCDVDDQLMCARFNVDGNGNKFYWMRVSYISSNTVQHVVDGKLVDCLEVRLDKSPKADNCQGVPEVGDALAVFGNRTKEDRQSVIVITAYNSFDIDLHAPYIAQYEHVNDFDLKSKKTTWLSKGDNNITGTFTVVSGGKKVSLDDFVTKISQATFKVEADKITARIDGIEKTQKTTVEKFAQLETTVDSITSTVARKSDLENVRSEIKQTAEEISLSVSNGTRPNLLWGSDLNLDGVDTTSKAAIQKHLGVGLGEIKVDDAEYFKYLKGDGVAGSDAVMFKSKDGVARWTFFRWEKIKVKPNTVYTMSAWVKFFPNRANVNQFYVGVNETVSTQPLAFKEGSDIQYYLAEIKDWERRHWTFTTKDETLITVLFAHSGTDESLMWLCRPKLEEGNKATPWCAYDGTVDVLEQTGIFIKDKKIRLNARNTEVSGDLSVGSLRTMPKLVGDPFIEAHDGEFNIFTFDRKKGIELSVDDSGMPHLIFYDKDGNPAYDLGWTGMKQLTDAFVQDYWSADFLVKEDSYTDANRISKIMESDCRKFYTYHASYNRKTGTYGSNEEYNDVTFVGKSFGNQRIADGFYYPMNNGSLARVANESAYIYGTRKYQYSNGKMIGFKDVYIEKDPVTGAWRFSNYKGGRGSSHGADQHSQP